MTDLEPTEGQVQQMITFSFGFSIELLRTIPFTLVPDLPLGLLVALSEASH